MGWRAPGETQDLNQKPRLDNMQPYYFTLPKLKLGIRAADYVALRLSCKTLPAELGRLGFCQKCSLEHLLLVFSRSCNCSKRGFWFRGHPNGPVSARNPV